MTIDPAAPLRGLSQQSASIAGLAFCPSCGVRLGAGDAFCRSCGTRHGNVEGLEAHAAPARPKGAVVPPAGMAPPAPAGHSRRSRALVTGGMLILLVAVAGALALTLGNSGPTLSQKPVGAVVALLGIVAMWAAAMVIALALCGTAAAGDRAMVDGERAEALKAGSQLQMRLANLEWAGQRKRRITDAREPATSSASATTRPAARQHAGP